MNLRLTLRRFIAEGVLVSLGWVAAAQDSGPASQSSSASQPNSVSQPSPVFQQSELSTSTSTPPSADDIISFLRSNPDLLASVKAWILQNAHEQGELLETTDLTDDALFRIIREDERARGLVVQKIEDYSQVRTPPLSSPEEEPDATASTSTGMEPETAGLPPSRMESETATLAPYRQRTANPSFTASRPQLRTSTAIPPFRLPPPLEDQNQPATTKQPNPYPDLPSARDLYRQFPNAGPTLKRFGDDIFLNGTGNLDALPMDLPAGPDYVLGPGDGLNITLWGSVSRKIAASVDREGQIVLPESGEVAVAGQAPKVSRPPPADCRAI
jgi:hypothetical protein